MAIVANITALEVIRGFTGGAKAVVTTVTCSGDCNVIHARIGPVYFGMAVITVVTAFDMVRGFAGRADQAGWPMTALTAQWRALENTVLVTTLATLSGMGTVEQKAGRVMIEFRRLRELAGQQHG